MNSNDSRDESLRNLGTQIMDARSSAEKLVRYNEGWAVRLRLNTMEISAEAAALQYLNDALKPERYMPPVGGWSVQYQVIASLVDLILHSEAEEPVILELGSGVSTSWIALALQRLGRGKVISLEHDPKYAKKTQYDLERLGLDGCATVLLSELAIIEDSNEIFQQKWYQPARIDAIVEAGTVDFLFVDGPPGNAGPQSRYPAFPCLSHLLSENALVILDDTDRKEEQEIAATWCRESETLNSTGVLSYLGTVGRSTLMKLNSK